MALQVKGDKWSKANFKKSPTNYLLWGSEIKYVGGVSLLKEFKSNP